MFHFFHNFTALKTIIGQSFMNYWVLVTLDFPDEADWVFISREDRSHAH